MAQQVWRLPTENASFPLRSDLAGRPVAVQNQDVQLQKTQDIPKYRAKLIYAENVLPVVDGLKSVAYIAKVPAAVPPVITFDEAWQVIDPAGKYGIFSPAGGANFFYPSTGPAWLTNPIAPAAPVRASQAIIGGQSYICYALTDVYTINCTTGVLTTAALTGINPVLDIIGITSANNYLIAYNDTTVFWSSPTNPSDFAPSLITGAGSGSPTELRGKIIACHPALNGFYIYSTEGILLATYSGNTQYPWIFKDIAGALAVKDAENVTHNAVDVQNFAITAAGVLKFTQQGSEAVFPEVGEFLASKRLETYTGTAMAVTDVGGVLFSRITRIGARYLVISYGAVAGLFTHALVYDISLQRWGKLKVSHAYCFPFPQALTVAPLHQIAFLANTGAVVTVDLTEAATTGAGVVLIGGIAMTRGTLLTLLEAEVNAGNSPYTTALFPSMDGKTLGAKIPLTADTTGLLHARVTALQHCLAVEGNFTLTSAQVTTVQYGVR